MIKDSWKVLIPDRLNVVPDLEQNIFGPETNIVVAEKTKEEEILPYVSDVDAILAWHDIVLTSKSISQMKQCKVIVRIGAGFDNVDIEYAGKNGIIVCNVPDYGTNDVADHSIALLLCLYRSIIGYNEKIKIGGDCWSWDIASPKRLTNKTLGIIGFGRIGIAVAIRAKSFGLKVIFYDPYNKRGIEKSLCVQRVEKLEDLLRESDIISFHCPLTNETENMADSNFFNYVKDQCVIINTARGRIIDFQALYDALKKGIVSAIGLDVLPEEPPNKKNPLISAWMNNEKWLSDRIIITPHSAFFSNDSFNEMRLKAAQEAKRVLKGDHPQNCVNKLYLSK